MCITLRTKFQVPTTILASFRQGSNFTPAFPPTSKLTSKKPPRLGLIVIENLIKHHLSFMEILKV